MNNGGSEEYRLDEIDRRIIHALMGDARNTSAPAIAETVSVSGATIRNRIAQLEDHGIVEGYQATVDFERADGSLMNLFLCHAASSNVEGIARQIGEIPGVINVRELIGGRLNLHILAVGKDTTALRGIERRLEALGLEVEDQFLLEEEHDFPYTPYGPLEGPQHAPLADYISLTGGAEIVEVTVREDAPIAGLTVEEAARQEVIEDQTLVIAIERDDTVITPHGETELQPNDVVTIFSPSESVEPTLQGFHEPDKPLHGDQIE